MKIRLMRLGKISWKLTIIYALIFSLILILLNAGTLYGVKYFLIHKSIAQVENSTKTTIGLIMGAPNEQTDMSDPEVLSEAQSNSDINIKIANSKGEIINSSENFNTSNIDITSNPDIVTMKEVRYKHLIIKNAKVVSRGNLIAYVQVVKNMDREYSFLKLLFVIMAVSDFIGIIISILVGLLISKRILKPIDKITTTAKKISISDLNSRIDVGEADDELTRLAVTFNEMIERLSGSFEKQNQFVSDASHELRTPISVIQGYISLIDRWGKDDHIALQKAINAIKKETLNMNNLVEELLFLARCDTNRVNILKEKFNLSQLIEEVIKESMLLAPERNLTYNVDKKVNINADREMLKQMFRALIDNSIKFTSNNGEISIEANVLSYKVNIIVQDNGIGIPKEDIDKIFDRFYRVDKTRSKETGGSGLGLSIVKRIIEAHNGKIFAESTVKQGTSIHIELPCD